VKKVEEEKKFWKTANRASWYTLVDKVPSYFGSEDKFSALGILLSSFAYIYYTLPLADILGVYNKLQFHIL
jgi:hypothetical protein